MEEDRYRIFAIFILVFFLFFSTSCKDNNEYTNENSNNSENIETYIKPELVTLDDDLYGRKQSVNYIKIDTKYNEILPVLSFDLVFGFEKTSDMIKRYNGICGVNGGFFYI